jgi:hypothetical protein
MVVPGEDDPVRVSVFCWRNSYFSALKLNVWIGIPDSAPPNLTPKKWEQFILFWQGHHSLAIPERAIAGYTCEAFNRKIVPFCVDSVAFEVKFH